MCGLRIRTAEDVLGDDVLVCDSALDAMGTMLLQEWQDWVRTWGDGFEEYECVVSECL